MTTPRCYQRLRADYIDLVKTPVDLIQARPTDENILEWHFVLRGPPDTDYEGGIYHGKLIFPADYPNKPPSIIMLTPSGRFQIGVRICLGVSDYHPELWSPAYRVRTVLLSLLSFIPDQEPTTGGMDASSQERRDYAKASWSYNLKDAQFCKMFAGLVAEAREKPVFEVKEPLSRLVPAQLRLQLPLLAVLGLSVLLARGIFRWFF